MQQESHSSSTIRTVLNALLLLLLLFFLLFIFSMSGGARRRSSRRPAHAIPCSCHCKEWNRPAMRLCRFVPRNGDGDDDETKQVKCNIIELPSAHTSGRRGQTSPFVCLQRGKGCTFETSLSRFSGEYAQGEASSDTSCTRPRRVSGAGTPRSSLQPRAPTHLIRPTHHVQHVCFRNLIPSRAASSSASITNAL